jgi:hypothetical protein
MVKPMLKPTQSSKGLLFNSIIIIFSGIVMFFPALAGGFWTDDFTFAEFAARLSFPQYLAQYFDPRMLESWYRPMQGMQWWIEFQFFRADPLGYHIVNLAFHILNCLLIMLLVTQVTQRLRLGLFAALVFLSLPITAVDVFWVAAADALMTLFYLTTCWLWLRYLQDNGRWRYVVAFVAFVATILTKEMGATVIAILFLIDRLVVGKPVTWKELILRYLPFAITLIPYALIEYYIQTRGVYVNLMAYRASGSALTNLAQYLKWLVFPWNFGEMITPIGIVAATLVIVAALVRWRNKQFLFVILAGVVSTFPVLPFPFPSERYLYLPAIASAILIALGFEFLLTRFQQPAWRLAVTPIALGLFFWWSSSVIYESAFNFSELARVTRLQFRPLYQKHPRFDQDTLLYFVDPPFVTPNIGSIMYLRYGENAHVYGTDRGDRAHLRERQNAIVVYFDDQKNLHTQTVDREAPVRVMPEPPKSFADSIAFDGFEIAQSTIKRGDALALILYWRALRKPEHDYKVFVHLVDSQGKQVAGIDNEPQQGNLHTSGLRANFFVPDGYIIPIMQDIPAGEYKIDVGLYRTDTQERLPIVDANGQPIADHFVFETIWVIE